MNPALRELLQLLGRADAGLRDDDHARRHVLHQALRAADVDAEVAQVAIVDADDLGADLQRAAKLVAVVHLDQHVEPERARLRV